MKKENKEKVSGGAPETTTPEKNFENRKGVAESKLRGILAELELGMTGQLHITRQGIIPIIVFVDEKKKPEAPNEVEKEGVPVAIREEQAAEEEAVEPDGGKADGGE